MMTALVDLKVEAVPFRIISRVDIIPEPAGHWLWLGAQSPPGYGSLHWQGETRLVHDVMYELTVGRVPYGLELDHVCRETLCCFPSHLEPVTHKVNVLRGVGSFALKAAQTYCLRGHLFDEKNTGRYRQSGTRYCKRCVAIRVNRLYHARKGGGADDSGRRIV